jgi:hypothetical protein
MKRRQATEKLSELVKDELAAVEAYRKALESVGRSPDAEELWRIENDHEQAVSVLQSKIAERGVEPPTASGPWPAGERGLFEGLKRGEEHGIRDYEQALADSELDSEIKGIISGQLLPLTRSHIPVLERFLNGRPS